MKTFKHTAMPLYSRFAVYSTAVLVFLFLIPAFYANAQRDKRGGERNGNYRDNTRRENTVREQPQREQRMETRRNDVAIGRPNSPRDYTHNQNPVIIDRNIKRDRVFENPGISREKNNYPAQVNRDYNRDRNNNPAQVNRDNNRDRNNYPGNVNSNNNREWKNNRGNQNNGIVHERNGYGNNDRREGTINAGRPRENDRRDFYTRERPGQRPEYRYDRQPAYDRYEPSWRYNCLPRRNSYYYSLPSSYFSINFGGFGYRYWDGVFYRPYNNLFTVCAPPLGIYIDILPVGYRRLYVRNYPYYYYNGTYYDQRGSGYTVVSPPVGAIVESLPDGYETVYIDGETYYNVDGAQYMPVMQENGEIWYEVIKAN